MRLERGTSKNPLPIFFIAFYPAFYVFKFQNTNFGTNI